MMKSLRVAAASVPSKPGETARNLENIRRAADSAAAEGTDLLLLPELSVSGFIPNHPTSDHTEWLQHALVQARRVAEPLAGPSVTALVEIARAARLHLAAGLLEDAGNLLYNTLVLAGPDGLLGAWRKLHIPMFEMPFYVGGPAPLVVDTPLGRVGANICFDALIPESTRLLAVQNVEIVLFPFAADPAPGTAAAWAEWAGLAVRARCVENGVFGLACNYIGHVACAGAEQSFPGGSMVVGPDGRTVAERTEGDCARLLLAHLEPETLLQARADPGYLYRFRRPELYRSLAE
jgi:N-carbamoylputrescine amidase